MRVSLREYARMRHVNPSSVLKAIQSGRIIRDDDGQIDVESADVDWFTNTNPAKKKKDILPETVKEGTSSTGDNSHMGQGTTYNQAKTAREYFCAMYMKERLDKYRGKLVDKQEARELFFILAQRQRDLYASLPNKFGSSIAAELGVDEHTTMVVLDAYIRKILAEGKEISDPFSSRGAES